MIQQRPRPPRHDDLPFLLPPSQMFPRLGIIHFLAWITVTAVLIGLYVPEAIAPKPNAPTTSPTLGK